MKLYTADSLSKSQGAKIAIFGTWKVGKTRSLDTFSDSVILSTDGGMSSMVGSQRPVCPASNVKEVEDFFAWYSASHEAKQYPNIAIDDATALCRLYLTEGKTLKTKADNTVHGQALYGKMADEVLKYFNFLRYRPNCHVVVLCKETKNGPVKRPLLPGKVLSAEIPHLFNEILHMGEVDFGAQGVKQVCFRTKKSSEIDCGVRSPHLADYEPINIDYIISKILTN